MSERTQVVSIPAVDEEPQEEFLTTKPNTLLLQQVASETGGKLSPTVRDLLARPTGTRRLTYGLDVFLIPLAMLCFLGDVAVRRLKK